MSGGSLDKFLNDNYILFNQITSIMTEAEQTLKNAAKLAKELSENPIIRGRTGTTMEEGGTDVQSADRYEQF